MIVFDIFSAYTGRRQFCRLPLQQTSVKLLYAHFLEIRKLLKTTQIMKTNQILNIVRLILVAGFLLAASQLHAQFSITGGDLYAYQIGNNTTAAGTAATPFFIDQFNTGGTLLNQVAVPVSAAGTFGSGLVASGQSATEGSLALNPSDSTLVFMGYSGIAVGTAGVNSQMAAAANRDIGIVDSSGNFSIAATSTTAFGPSAGAGRGAVTDGSGNYWAVGTGSSVGVVYYGNNASAAQVTTTSSARSIEIYGGNLYYTAGSVLDIVSAATGAANPTTLFTPGGTPDGFVFNPGMTTCYVAEGAAGGGIQRWDLVGGIWTKSYTLDTASGFSFVTADFSGANPVLYATTLASSGVDSIDAITDTGAGAGVTVLDTTTETSGDATFNGLVFDPVATPEPSVFMLTGLGLVLFIGGWRKMHHQY